MIYSQHFCVVKLGLQEVAVSLQDAVSELKDRVRAQYRRMQALLQANQEETMQMLESTYMMYVRKNSQQSLQLNEKRQEAEKLLSSVQTVFQRAESVNFMKVRITSSVFHLLFTPTSASGHVSTTFFGIDNTLPLNEH